MCVNEGDEQNVNGGEAPIFYLLKTKNFSNPIQAHLFKAIRDRRCMRIAVILARRRQYRHNTLFSHLNEPWKSLYGTPPFSGSCSPFFQVTLRAFYRNGLEWEEEENSPFHFPFHLYLIPEEYLLAVRASLRFYFLFVCNPTVFALHKNRQWSDADMYCVLSNTKLRNLESILVVTMYILTLKHWLNNLVVVVSACLDKNLKRDLIWQVDSCGTYLYWTNYPAEGLVNS